MVIRIESSESSVKIALDIRNKCVGNKRKETLNQQDNCPKGQLLRK